MVSHLMVRQIRLVARRRKWAYAITVTTTDASGNKTETKFTIEVVDKTAPTVTAIKDQIKK